MSNSTSTLSECLPSMDTPVFQKQDHLCPQCRVSGATTAPVNPGHRRLQVLSTSRSAMSSCLRLGEVSSYASRWSCERPQASLDVQFSDFRPCRPEADCPCSISRARPSTVPFQPGHCKQCRRWRLQFALQLQDAGSRSHVISMNVKPAIVCFGRVAHASELTPSVRAAACGAVALVWSRS